MCVCVYSLCIYICHHYILYILHCASLIKITYIFWLNILIWKYHTLKSGNTKQLFYVSDPNPDSQTSAFPCYSLGDFTHGIRSLLLTHVYLLTDSEHLQNKHCVWALPPWDQKWVAPTLKVSLTILNNDQALPPKKLTTGVGVKKTGAESGYKRR